MHSGRADWEGHPIDDALDGIVQQMQALLLRGGYQVNVELRAGPPRKVTLVLPQ